MADSDQWYIDDIHDLGLLDHQVYRNQGVRVSRAVSRYWDLNGEGNWVCISHRIKDRIYVKLTVLDFIVFYSSVIGTFQLMRFLITHHFGGWSGDPNFRSQFPFEFKVVKEHNNKSSMSIVNSPRTGLDWATRDSWPRKQNHYKLAIETDLVGKLVAACASPNEDLPN